MASSDVALSSQPQQHVHASIASFHHPLKTPFVSYSIVVFHHTFQRICTSPQTIFSSADVSEDDNPSIIWSAGLSNSSFRGPLWEWWQSPTQQLSQILGCLLHGNIKKTCASSERIFQTPDLATSHQTGCRTSGDKIYFYFQEAICLPFNWEIWPKLKNNEQLKMVCS